MPHKRTHISYNIHKLLLVVTYKTVILYLFKNIFVKTLISDHSDYVILTYDLNPFRRVGMKKH